MKISLIIEQLRTYAITFGGRVAGAAEYDNLAQRSNLTVPAAYVVPLDDDTKKQSTSNSYRQEVSDAFSVVVVLANTDERGQTAADSLHLIRAELWQALLGWSPDTEYGGIEYDGGALIGLNRSRLDYQFEFYAVTEIDPSMTFHGIELSGKPAFSSIKIDIDHSELPPDGVVDHVIDITL